MPVGGIHDIPAKHWMLSQRNTSFLGTRAVQRAVDFVVWEKLLNKYEDMQAIMEFGTGRGAFSLYLLLQCLQRGMQFYTFDNRSIHEAVKVGLPAILDLTSHFCLGDIFGEEGMDIIGRALQQPFVHPLVLFCDDGDKPREFKTFVPLLSPGDIVGVHDWTEEFGPLDVTCMKHLLIPIFHEECETVNSITRFWQRV